MPTFRPRTATGSRRRSVFATAGLALGALVLAGCTPAADAAGPASFTYTPGEDAVELQFWTAAVEGVNQQLVDNFNSTRGKDLNIHVTATYQGGYAEAEQKVNAAALADTLPNVFVDEVGMTERFADSDTTIALDPYMEAADMDDADFQIGATGNLYTDDKMFALPHMRSVPVMYVNKPLMRELGFSEDGPQTLGEMETVLRAAHAKTGKPALTIPNYDFWVMEALFYSYADLPVLNDDETASNLGSDGAIDTVTWLGSMISDGVIKVNVATELDDFQASVGRPETALTLTSSGAIQSFQKLAAGNGIELGVSLFPSGDDGTRGVSVGGSNVFLANTGTDQDKAAAFEFMRWTSDTEQAAFASANTGYIAVRKSSQDTELLTQTFASNPGYAVAAEGLQYGKTRPMAKAYSEIQDLMIERIGTMWATGQDPETVMPKLADETDKVLSR